MRRHELTGWWKVAYSWLRWLLAAVLLWATWDWYGANAVNAAAPGAHAQGIDFWAALGLISIIGTLMVPVAWAVTDQIGGD